jgi:hypothetical protein
MSDKNYIKEIEKSINERLHKKYFIDPKDYNKIKIENILCNNKTKLVSQFKEQLIIGDIFEFLSKYYLSKESIALLHKCILFYEKNYFFYPSYRGLPESTYLFKNINSKQRILDEQLKKFIKNNKNIINDGNINIFDHSVYDSILKCSSFSELDLKKDKEKLDSIADINNLIKEMEKNNDININNKNITKQNKCINSLEKNDNIFNKLDSKNKTNFYYNKFRNQFINKINYNKTLENIRVNQNKKNDFSNIYIKANIKQKFSKKKINPIICFNSNFSVNKNKDDSLISKIKSTLLRNKIIKRNIRERRNFTYYKFYSINTKNKLSFSTKRKSTKLKDLQLSINTCKNKKFEENKNPLINIEIFSYSKKPDIHAYHTVKNQYINNKIIFTENITPVKVNRNEKLNKIMFKGNNTDNNKNKAKNLLEYIPRENNIYILNNSCIDKPNLNIINKKMDLKIRNKLLNNKQRTLSKEKNKISKTNNKLKSINNIINSIRNKIKKENKINVSESILQIMKNKKDSYKIGKKNSYNDLNENINSFKSLFKLYQKRKNNKIDLKNKLILSPNNSGSKSIINILNSQTFINPSLTLNISKLNTSKNSIGTSIQNKINKISSSNESNHLIMLSNKDETNSILHLKKAIQKFKPINSEKNELNYKNYIKNKNNLNNNNVNNTSINGKKLSKKIGNKIIKFTNKKISNNSINNIILRNKNPTIKLYLNGNKTKSSNYTIFKNKKSNENNMIKEFKKIKLLNISPDNTKIKFFN